MSSPVENSNHSINIPNNANEIDSDEVMEGEETNINNNNQEGNTYDNNNNKHQMKSPSRGNKSNGLKQKGGLGDEKLLEINDNRNIERNEHNRRRKFNNNFRSFVEEDTDEDESILEEEEEDEEIVGDERTRHRYYSLISKYNKALEKIASSSYPSTQLNPIITDKNENQNSEAVKPSNYYANQYPCADCENCSDQEMYNEFNQYGKRINQSNQDPLSPYSGSTPPTALSDVPNIVTMYDELSPNTQSLVLLNLLKRCPVSTLQFVSSLILPVLKYDILTLLPVELTYKILNYLDIEDIYHCMMVCRAWKKIIDSPGAELSIWKQKLIEKQWYDEEKIHAILTEYKQRKLKAKAKKASQLLLLQHPNSVYLMDGLYAFNSSSSSSYSSSSTSTSSSFNNNNTMNAMNISNIPMNNTNNLGNGSSSSQYSSISNNNASINQNMKFVNDMQGKYF